MKRTIITLALAALAATFASGQTKGDASAEAEIVTMEKRAFEAWKNKDKKFFEEHMAEDGQYLDANGVGGEGAVRAGDHRQ